jgi:hypothetical protein
MALYHWICIEGTDIGVFLVPYDDKFSYPELAVKLLQIGAREIKEPIDWFEYARIIGETISNDIKLESLKYDLIGLAYRALVIAAPKYNALEALLTVLEDKDFISKRNRVLAQISPSNKTNDMLYQLLDDIDGPYKYKSNNPYLLGCSFYQSEIPEPVSFFSTINRVIGASVLDYLFRNYDYEVYYQIGNGIFWHQSIKRGEKSKGIVIKEETYLIFEDIAVVKMGQMLHYSLNPSNEAMANPAVGITIHSRSLSNLIDKAFNTGLVLDCTTDNPVVIPFDKYKGKVFELSTFTYECNEVFDVKDLLDRERVGILCYGEPGVGKSSWVYSLYYHLLLAEGYVLLNMGYKQYLNLEICIDPVLKAIILVNDADSIESEENRAKVLARLESNIFARTITIFTVNSVENLDKALLRKGRTDYHLEFTKVMV